jgi:hypothetical protein
MLSSSFWYQGRISLKAFPNSSLLKGLEKKKWKKKMMENNRAILRLCLTRKFWFFLLLLLLLSIFVTQRLSQTARNKRFETTSLRTSGIEKNALVPDSGTNRMDRESKEI